MLFFLLLIPIKSLANVDQEVCFAIGNNETLCNSTAGCFYDPETSPNKCKQCPETYYCPPDEQEPKKNCPESFSKSESGAESAEDCFKEQTTPCSNELGQEVDCWEHYDSDIRCGTGHNIVTHQEDNSCYYNIRVCSAFNQSGCTQGATNQIYGTAYWENGHWSINEGSGDCHCEQTGVTKQDAGCIASTYKIPQNSTLNSATQQIVYETSYYYCTGCPAGKYVNPNTDFAEIPSQCYADLVQGDNVVCQCSETGFGHYSTGFNITYPINGTDTYAPYLANCPFGKTTDHRGATSADACNYSPDTQFCDAKGCFQLNSTELQEWGLINP